MVTAMSRLILDLATVPLDGAEQWLTDVSARSDLVDPAKIAADIAKKKAAQRDSMALDLDLCRVSGIGLCDVTGWEHGPITVNLFESETQEKTYLAGLHRMLKEADTITFNGISFDLAVLERRMLYCGLPPLGWNLDKFRSPHVDLLAKLSDYGKRPYRSLDFYRKRLGWSDLVKPLTGAQEAEVCSTGQWEALEASLRCDVETTKRLAVWMGVLKPSQVAVL